MNLTAERERLADLLDGLGIHAVAFVPDQIEMTTAVVRPGDPYVDYHPAFGAITVNLEVIVLTPTKNVDFDWQHTIDDLLSDGEIVDAIETDGSFQVEGAFNVGMTNVNGVDCPSVTLRVTDFVP